MAIAVAMPVSTPENAVAALIAAAHRAVEAGEMRASGFIDRAIAASGIIGIATAPAGSWRPSVPE
jgi:hypothetical protein